MAITDIEPIRHKTYFGSGAHRQCTAKNRTTGLQCKNPAAFGMTTCRSHGARRKGPGIDKKGLQSTLKAEAGRGHAKRRFLCSAAASDDLKGVLVKNPRAVSEYHKIERMAERGKFILEALQNIDD